MKKIFVFLMTILMSISVCACGDTQSQVGITLETVALRIGEEAYVKVGEDNETSYTSDDESVATVLTTGVGYICIKAVGLGVAEVSMKNGTVYRVGVNRPAMNVFDVDSVDGNTLLINLFESETHALSIEESTKNLANGYEFSLDDMSTAIVGADGVIRAKKEGVTTLTVKRKSDGLSRKINVVVTGDRSAQYAREFYAGTDVVKDRHIQGVASNGFGDYVIYGGTDQILKIDKEGNLVGSVLFKGTLHIGDVAYDDQTGWFILMASHSKGTRDVEKDPNDPSAWRRNCFVYLVDGEKIVKENMTPEEADVHVVYIGDPIISVARQSGYGPYADAIYQRGVYGKFGIANTCDSCAIGPRLGGSDGKRYLTFAGGSGSKATTYTMQKQELDGTYVFNQDGTPKMVAVTNGHRIDNDYLVLMQLEVDNLLSYARPFSEFDTVGGPKELDNLALFYYGYHDHGIQTLTYDSYENVYMASCYGISNIKDENGEPYGTQFTNYKWFAIDAANGSEQELIGNGGERGLVMNAKYGKLHEATGIRGWRVDSVLGFSSDTGMISMGDGYVYLSDSGKYAEGSGYVFDHSLILCKWGDYASKMGEGGFGMTIVK